MRSFVYVSHITCMSESVFECAIECVYVLKVIEHYFSSEWVKSCVKSGRQYDVHKNKILISYQIVTMR